MDLLATALLQIAQLTTGIMLLEGLVEAHGTSAFGLDVAPMVEKERIPAREEGGQGCASSVARAGSIDVSRFPSLAGHGGVVNGVELTGSRC